MLINILDGEEKWHVLRKTIQVEIGVIIFLLFSVDGTGKHLKKKKFK